MNGADMKYKKRKVKMSLEEYHALIFDPGWKQEYMDGYLYLSPRHVRVLGKVLIEKHEVASPCILRAATPEDRDALIDLYVEAFADTVHYFYLEPEDVQKHAQQDLDTFLSGQRGAPLFSSSRLALAKDRLIGAALINEGHIKSPLLYLLFVAPNWRQKGIARALVQAAMNDLWEDGHRSLRSQYDLGNHESRAWHERMGFQAEPDWQVYQLLRKEAESLVKYHEAHADLSVAERRKLKKKCADLQAKCDAIEAMVNLFGYDVIDAHLGLK
jgi:GNAT superfamily N-acetyltransferase